MKSLPSCNLWMSGLLILSLSLSLFKKLIKSQRPALRNADGTFPKTNESSLYKTFFNQTFVAHNALKDVLDLRKNLFSAKTGVV